ncbi:MAG: hypothetical protein D6722_02370, partial [Bacteroidetes bacterium]
MKPPRLWSLPALFYVLARHYLRPGNRRGEVPTPAEVLTGGIAGVCSSLDVASLLEGYARGLFPFS